VQKYSSVCPYRLTAMSSQYASCLRKKNLTKYTDISKIDKGFFINNENTTEKKFLK